MMACKYLQGAIKEKIMKKLVLIVITLLCASMVGAQNPLIDPQRILEEKFRTGQDFTLDGQKLFIEKIQGGKLILSPPAPRTETIGAFITPVGASASSAQDGAGRTAGKMIDGSGWGESFRGSGVYIHTNDVYDGGSNMWNGAGDSPVSWVQFDLGQEFNVAGFYFWNYNEGSGYANRSAKDVDVMASPDGEKFASVGNFTLQEAPGSDDYKGQTVAFEKPTKARFLRFNIQSNYKGSDVAGIAEIRFADADAKPADPNIPWKATYPRPAHPALKPAQVLAGGENIIFPKDMGIVDVTQAPYNAKADGVSDDTAVIQKALDDHPNQGAIIYLPNGKYLVSDTLRWPMVSGDEATVKNTVLQGQSRDGTVIQLKDNAPRFDVPRRTRGVLGTGRAPAQRFGNEVRNLTIDTGLNNPGACGMQFMANNQGGVYDVTIMSGDGQGAIGLDMSYTDEEGPLLIKNIKVQGFDFGITTATSLASETMEHIRLEHQNVAGFRNVGQAVSVRDLQSLNHVPAVLNGGGQVTLIDCNFQGENNAVVAIRNEANLLVRNLQTSGYAVAIDDRTSKQKINGPKVAEFRAPAPKTLLYTATSTLGLPIKDTPDVAWDELANWVSPQKFGAKTDDGQDDSDAIQKAIDAGATTIYLPRGGYNIGKTIIIRGKVRRIIGGKAYLMILDSLKKQNAPVFRFEDGDAPVVVIERLTTDFSEGPFYFMEHAAKRTLVMSALMVNFQGSDAYRNTGSGDVFIEDVVGQAFRFTKQNVWARQFNSELNFHPGMHVVNDGGALWSLGFKTEGGGTQIETKNGGRTEVLGGLIGDTNAGNLAPMFINNDSQVSITVVEVSFNNDPFDKLVLETRDGKEQRWNIEPNLSGMRPVVYEGHK